MEKSGAGKEGVTNYIHMLASGHIKYYMTVYWNLYKYSQQGWESLNENTKLTFLITLNAVEIWGKTLMNRRDRT